MRSSSWFFLDSEDPPTKQFLDAILAVVVGLPKQCLAEL